jgi:hypothetical protein
MACERCALRERRKPNATQGAENVALPHEMLPSPRHTSSNPKGWLGYTHVSNCLESG